MTLPSLIISKNWFTATTVREANWDNIRTPLLDWAAKVNLAFNQIVVDAFGSNYTIDNDGIPNLATSLQDQINAIIAGSATISTLTLIDNATTGATLNQFTARWRSPTPATSDALIFRQSFNSNTTQDAIQSQIQFQITDVTHATRGSAISWFTMNNGTLAETLRLGATGAIGLISGQKIFLDGVALTGNTSIRESSANTIMLETDGGDRVAIGPTGAIGLISGQRIFLDGVALTGDTSIRESAANTITFEAGGSDLVTLSSAGLNLLSTLPLFIPTTAPAANRSLALVSNVLQIHDGTSAKSYLRTDGYTEVNWLNGGASFSLGSATDGAFVDISGPDLTFTVNAIGVYQVRFEFSVAAIIGANDAIGIYFRLTDGTTHKPGKIWAETSSTATVPQSIITILEFFSFNTTGSKTIKLQKQIISFLNTSGTLDPFINLNPGDPLVTSSVVRVADL